MYKFISGRSRIFLTPGCTCFPCFFWQNTSCIRKPPGHDGGGGYRRNIYRQAFSQDLISGNPNIFIRDSILIVEYEDKSQDLISGNPNIFIRDSILIVEYEDKM